MPNGAPKMVALPVLPDASMVALLGVVIMPMPAAPVPELVLALLMMLVPLPSIWRPAAAPVMVPDLPVTGALLASMAIDPSVLPELALKLTETADMSSLTGGVERTMH